MMYVISTMASSVEYCLYDTSRKDINILKDKVLIVGKTGVANKKSLETLTGGTITPITEQQYSWLKDNPLFKQHEKNGFIRVEKTKMSAENKAEKEAEVKDKSAQLTAEDFKEQGIAKPKVSVEEVMTTEDTQE